MKQFLLSLTLVILANFTLFAQDQTYNFDGTSQYAEVNYNAALNPSHFTIEAWALTTSGTTSYQTVISSLGGTNHTGYAFYAHNNLWKFAYGTGGSFYLYIDGPTVTVNKWTHLAATYNGSTIVFYVDGIQAGTVNATIIQNTTNPFTIAKDYAGDYFTGDVDEVRLWNTARTAAQIHANVFKDLSATESGLVADYKMDVTGTTLTNSCTNVSGLNGTTHNNPPQYQSSIAYQQNTLSFDGSDDNILVSTNPAGSSSSFSIEAWAKVTGGSGYRGVISSTNASYQGFVIYAHDNTWEFWVGTGSGWIQLFGPTIVLNKWTHVAGTYDGTNSRFYVDGIPYSTSSSFTYSANPNILRIGASDNAGNASFFFNGDIDEVKIWNTAKSIGEMNNTLHSYFDPTSATNLVAYYSVNQGLNAGSNTFLKTLYDFVGGHNGTMNNFTLTSSTSNFITSGVPLISNAAPAGVAGANLWLKANTGVTNSGSNLTGWTDQSGLNTFTVHGTVGYTANSVNFNPAVAISSTNTSQLPDNRLDGNTEIQIVEAFAVYKDDIDKRTTILGNVFTSNPGLPKGIFLGLPSDGDSYVSGQVAYNYYTPESVGVRFVMDNVDISSPTTSPYLSAWSNGAAKAVTVHSSISFPGILDYTNVTLTPIIGGTNYGGSDYPHMRAKLAEIIAYPNGLSASDRSKVQSYLALKYGISLAPSVTSYVNSAGTILWNNTTYWNDVFGIGKDDASGLNQTQSNSINTGSGDGTGQSTKGNIVLSNASSLGNGDFLMMGHDNAALTEQATEVPTVGQRRVAREWLVKRTGDPGTVDLSFDILGLTLTGTTAADFKLLIDADGDFSSGATVVNAASLTGTKVAFTGVTIPDGSYLTIVTGVVVGPGVLGANLWLKANDGATNSGANLTGWTDKTGINTFTVTGTPTYTAQGINFNPNVGFSNSEAAGTQPGSRLDGNNSLPVVSGFAVYKSTDAGSGALLGSTTPTVEYGVQYFGGFGANQFWAGPGKLNETMNYSDPNLSTTSPAAILENSYATGNNCTSRLNGANKTITFGSWPISAYNFTPRIGGTNNQGTTPNLGWNHFRGEVAEIVLYPTSLSTADKLKVESYLAIKYGITLDPSVTNYVNSAGTVLWNNTTYWNDIFGIAKDDGSGLNQTSSNSINTGSGDGTGQSGLGNIVLSSPSAMATGDFLLIGHDNAGLTEQTTDLPSAYNGSKRLAREWKVAHTNDVGTVTMTFNTTGLTVTGTTAANFALLIDNDGNGDFSNGTFTKINAASFSGNVITFNNVSLPNNAVFTIVSSLIIDVFQNSNLWIKTNAGVTESGGNVTGWTDQSGVNTFTVIGTVGYTANSINFNPAASIVNNEGANQLPSNYLAGNTELTYVDGFAVMKRNPGTPPNVAGTLVGSAQPTSGDRGVSIFAGYDSDEMLVFNGNFGTYSKFTNSNVADGKLALVNLDVSLSSTPYATGRLNGAQQTMTTGSGSDFSSISFTPWIGGTNSGGYTGYPHFKGEFSEVILYSSSLSAADKLKMESYLAIKYGINLDQSVTNYINSDGTVLWNNTAYWHDVFGIGKDDGSGLNQTSSNSINTGSGDGTGQSGKGNIVLSNASDLGNLEFLMMGHDNAALTEQTTEVPTVGQKRVAREWLVKLTGDPGTVNLSFDIAGLTLTGTMASDFKLLIDADGDFSSGATEIIAASLTGTKVAFTGQTIPDGSYLTIVTGFEQVGPGVLGARLWLKANDGATTSGSNLTGWTDQTGMNTFTLTGTAGYATNSINFNPTASFQNDVTVNQDPVNYLTGNTPITYVDGFAVMRKSFANCGALVGSDAITTNYGVAIFSGEADNQMWVGNGVNNSYQHFVNPALTVGNVSLVNFDISRTASPYATGRMNGLDQTIIAGSAGDFSSMTFTPRIGATNNNSSSSGWSQFRGEVAEIVLYPSSLSTADKLKVESYLAIKYGITLDPSVVNYLASNGTTILWNNTTYWHDVFGIGQDDGSGLTQSSSNSANTGSGDGTGQSGKGNIVLSNASSLANGDFLIIGNNNGALIEETSDLPASLNGKERLTREWKVAHTNDVGTVTLTFNTLGLTLSGTTASDFMLIVDEDGNGNFTDGTITQITPATYTNNILTFNNVALNNGVVFTFVTGASVSAGGINDALLWYKADAGVTLNGSAVSQWNNQGSLSNANAVQATPANQPQQVTSGANQINFNPIISFDNTDELSTTSTNTYLGTAGNRIGSQFAVYRVTSDADAYVYSAEDGNTYLNIGMQNKGMTYQQMFAGSGISPVSTPVNNQIVLMNMIATTDINNYTVDSGTLRQNGIPKDITSDGVPVIPADPAALVFGKSGAVQLAEMISFNRLLDNTERSKLESYLAIKYGITLGNNTNPVNYILSDGTTVVWTGNATYQNDIFGIGKDVAGDLSQTQSNSMNTGSGDGTGQSGKGNIVLSNASSLADGDFLMIGHNNSDLTEQTIDLPASLSGTRLAREWKVKRTGDVGTVTMTLDLSGLTVTGTALADFKLLIDTDGNGDFTSGAVTEVSPASFSSNILTFNTLTLPDDAVFTLFTKASTTITWAGTTDTDWATATNWTGGVAPTSIDNAVIPNVSNDPVIAATGQITLNNLTIEAGGALTIASDATGTGSLKINGTLSNSGTITSQHYLKGAAQAWHMIGAPVAGGIASNGWNPTAGQDDFYAWDEPTPGTWVNYDNTGTPSFTTVNGGMDFVPGKGYLVAYNAADPTKTFVGTLNTGNVNFPLKRSSAKSWTYFSGWNLMANPYSSAIDWNLATRTQFEDNFAYAYDPNKSGGEGYVNIDGSQANAYIAPHQAFFVRATQAANNSNFTFTNAIQSHGGSNYKNGNSASGIVLRLASGDFYDETTIRLMDESTANRDRNDAVKMYSFNPAIPQLYSFSADGASLAVNSLNQISAEKPIAMGFKAGTEASYTLSLVQSNAQLTGSGLFIEDKNLGTIHRLDQLAYSFSAEPGEVTDRLVLHFGMVGLDEPAQESAANVWFAGEQLYLQSSEAFQQMDLFDLQGRRIFSSSLSDAPLQTININKLQNGLYIVRLSGAEKVFSAKVKFIR